jgi:hypothetical protein
MPALGYSQDTAGIVATYGDLISDLVVHIGDEPATPLDAGSTRPTR